MSISLRTGGIERQYVRLANQMVSLGHQVDFLLCKKDGPFLEMLDSKIRVFDFGTEVPRKSIPGLAAYLKEHRPEGILGGHDAVNIAVVEAVRRAKVPTRSVFCAHNTMSVRYGREQRDFRSRLRGMAVKMAARRAGRVGAVSSQSADDLAAWANIPRKYIAVPYVPIVSSQLILDSKRPPQHPWLVAKTGPVAITVGRQTELKQLDILIRAIKELPEAVRLINFGEGPEQESLKSLVKEMGLSERVSFPGVTANPAAEMAAADLVVLSSRMEGLPAVLIEGLAAGVPIVSTDCTSGPREILEEGKWGRLVPVGDQHALAKAIEESLKDPIRPTPESWSRFTVEESTNRYLDLLLG